MAGAQEHVTVETGHGREETQTYLQPPAPAGLPGFGLWKALRTIAVVTSLCIRDGKESVEVRVLHQQPGPGREAAGAGRAGPLGDRERLPLDPRSDVSRGRVADPRGVVARELRVAQSLHAIAVEAAPGRHQHRDEAPQLQLGREPPAASPYRISKSVCAGPASRQMPTHKLPDLCLVYRGRRPNHRP